MAKEYIELCRARFEFERFFKGEDSVQHDCDSLLCMIPAADVVEVVRCQNCVHAEPFERNCELNGTAYMHCTRGRGEEVRNVWHKYKKYYRDYSVVDRDGYCDEGERRDNNAAD